MSMQTPHLLFFRNLRAVNAKLSFREEKIGIRLQLCGFPSISLILLQLSSNYATRPVIVEQ